MTLTQQRRHLNLTRNSFYVLFLAKCIVSCRQIISSRLYVRLKKNLFTHWPSTFKHRWIKKKNLNADHMKIPKTHRGPHKCPRVSYTARVFAALVYMVVNLHAHWNKYLLYVKFSYREHCWWLTSQTCVNTLINETSVKFEATTFYQFEI